ncbi:uncharacterized protein METZ01_LOCUS45640 [marine metagenome]|uniref:Uncharacterized protein n=1 Tax=marine metagenome TaxID=408172 RepID=A0A381RLQ9_9ZZZZ
MYSLQSKVYTKLLCLALYAVILIPGKTTFAADICTDGLKELQGSQGVIQDKGGIWGYLEQSKSLSSKSLLGLQIDGKLQRLISIFENLCSEGKIPTGSLHAQILSLIGDARMIFNRPGDQRKKEQLMETLNNLHKNINDLLAKLPN